MSGMGVSVHIEFDMYSCVSADCSSIRAARASSSCVRWGTSVSGLRCVCTCGNGDAGMVALRQTVPSSEQHVHPPPAGAF